MTIQDRKLLPSVWPLALLGTLPFAPGCWGGSDGKGGLTPVWDGRGVVTYRYAAAGSAAPSPSRSPRPAPAQGRRFYVEDWRPRQNDVAYQDVRRARDEQWRREQQEFQDYQETR